MCELVLADHLVRHAPLVRIHVLAWLPEEQHPPLLWWCFWAHKSCVNAISPGTSSLNACLFVSVSVWTACALNFTIPTQPANVCKTQRQSNYFILCSHAPSLCRKDDFLIQNQFLFNQLTPAAEVCAKDQELPEVLLSSVDYQQDATPLPSALWVY